MKKLRRTFLLLLFRLFGAPGVRAATKAHQLASKNPRILLIHPGPLGSLVLTTPVFHALKICIPGAHITMMVGPWSSEVVAHHPDIDQLITFTFPSYRSSSPKGLRSYIVLLRAARRLQHDNYDLAINLHRNFWWGAALIYLARIPHRIGYAISPATPFLTQALPFQARDHATVSRLRTLSAALQALRYPQLDEPYTPEHYPLRVLPTTEEQQWATQFLNTKGIDPADFVVVIHPGTSVAVKQWRSEAWAACATALTESMIGTKPVHFILTGTTKEYSLLEEIARGTSAKTTLVTNTTVGQLAALLQRVHIVLGVDSGPMHLAVAQGTPTVQIFGPTDPRRYGAWGDQASHPVVVSTHRCPGCPSMPCGRLHFEPQDLASHPCVRLVPEKQVLTEISRLLSGVKPLKDEPVQA